MEDSNKEFTPHPGDVIFDAFAVAAIGGSIVALFFLVVDIGNGQALFTPSLMGSVLFTGAAADGPIDIQLNMVAYYTIVHYLTFGVLGILVSVVVHQVGSHTRHPTLLLLLLFLLFELGFLATTHLILPGVIARIGALPVGMANFLAAGGIASFLVLTHRPVVWQRLKHAVHLT